MSISTTNMIYAFVKNKTIVEGPRSLPENWENISRLDLFPAETLLELGWYPVISDPVPVYDGSTQYLTTQYVVEETRVLETFTVVDFTMEELNESVEQAWTQLRRERDQFLSESDWTELPSVRARRSAEWAVEWDNYRQSLRDITDNTSIDMVVWPEKPSSK
jgi:CRISPR/Cas system CMR subunit Cmr4 (Cas7 group RAMP superfamily)